MDFVSTDRSRDAEYTRGLQEYNRSVFENNKELSAQIDKSKGDLSDALDNAQEVADLNNLKTSGALGGIGAGALERGVRGTTEFGKFKIAKKASDAKAAAKAARGGYSEVAITAEEAAKLPSGAAALDPAVLGSDGQKIRGALRATTKFRPTAGLLRNADIGEDSFKTISEAYGGGAKGKKAAIAFKQAQRLGVQPTEKILERGSVKAGAKVVGARVGTEAAERGAEKAGEKTAAKVGEEAVEKAAGSAGKVIGKLAGGVARGAGVAGAALSAGSAIEGLVEGKKFKFSEQGLEIGGALLDILGTGAEFIPGGQLLGVGLQLAGTAISTAGTINEGLDTEPDQVKNEQAATDLQKKTQDDLEAAKQQAISRITQAGAGGAAVGRQAQ